MNKLSFKLETFEGPLDLLIHLISKNKVSIYDIPIAQITDQYFEYLGLMEEVDLEISSEFIITAAELLYIKSKMLLPKAANAEDEEDPREDLVQRLLEYKMYKDITAVLSERVDKFGKRFYKEPEIVKLDNTKSELISLSSDDLINAFNSIFSRRIRLAPPPKESFDKIIKNKKVSIRSKAREIIKLLDEKGDMKFIDVFSGSCEREDVIAIFLAILELVKLNIIKVFQKSNSDEMILKKNKSHKDKFNMKGEYLKE